MQFQPVDPLRIFRAVLTVLAGLLSVGALYTVAEPFVTQTVHGRVPGNDKTEWAALPGLTVNAYEMTLNDPSFSQMLLQVFADLPSLVALTVLVILLRWVVGAVGRSGRVRLTVVQRLRVLGIVAPAVGGFAYLVEARVQRWLDMSLAPGDQGEVAVNSFPLGLWLVTGVVMFAMASIVERVAAASELAQLHRT